MADDLNDLEKKFTEVKADEIAEKAVEKIEDSDTVFTKTGRVFDPSEIHPFQIGAGLAFLGYLITPAFLAVHFGLMVKGVVDVHVRKKQATGIIKQIGEELHYYIVGTVLIVGLLQQQGYAPPEVTIKSLELIKILLGA